ncbi:hypothetical protein PG984_007353 [Apiospora sp. TS-2023a]
MTKDWDTYKETILALYEHQTLSQVMEIMKRDYGFEASTRAYRQKLDKWGKRKYKKRKGKSDNSPDVSDIDSADEAAPASPQVSRRKGDTHATVNNASYGVNAAAFQQGDANYSLNHHGTGVSNAYNPAQYQNESAYGATDNSSYWAGGGYSDNTTAQSYSQATPLDPNAAAAAYGYDGMAYPTDNTGTTPFHYMDASGGGGGSYTMDGQMNYATYPDGGSWDHTQDG